MVRDGYYYALALLLVAALSGYLTGGSLPGTPLIAVPVLLAAFFLWFFRDPERQIPQGAGLVVSPADGKVTEVAAIETPDGPRQRISIFLNVFNVHVNRAPIGGVLREVAYKKGRYLNAMDPASAEFNEQNLAVIENEQGGEAGIVAFKQIAGLLARRIVFQPRVGERLERGQRVGLIKFGSRCDVILSAKARVRVQVGQVVKGGSSILADLLPAGDGIVIDPPNTPPALPPGGTGEFRG